MIDKGIFDRDLIPLDVSCKEADDVYGPISSMDINGDQKQQQYK